ncbi:kinesin-like protein subito [Phlebotomus papatasi]|uniref:kinesin-like protein subito n=1 Tax=Phlebotomus papatasi TaxID=29031 RepID=UPI0024841A28|nr:kinesin-like protein subito [Phlebotomus papatasi]
MSNSFLQPRDPSIDMYNRPVPIRLERLEPLLQEIEEDEHADSASSRDASQYSDNISLSESKADVYLRLRDIGNNEVAHRKMYEATSTGLKVMCVKSDASGRNKTPCTQLYSFTRVFETTKKQTDVYHTAIKQHVDNEEHAVFLTYGTSGSGKTYTLLGNKNNPGVIPRAVEQIFTKYKDQLAAQPTIKFSNGLFELLDDDKAIQEEIIRRKILDSPDATNGLYDYEEMAAVINREESFTAEESNGELSFIWVSFMEIYNEKVYDLLNISPLDTAKRQELKIISNKGFPYAKNLTHIYAKSSEDVIKILNYGINKISYGSTMINARSSRSHSVFSVLVIKFSKPNNYSCVSYRFGDLAGSERLKKTENVGNRLREAQNINKSLMCLRKCLSVLQENRQKKLNNIVPFRDSKLTLLIQTALLGKENLVLIVNLYPIEAYYEENLTVLDFASIAREMVKSPIKKVKVRYSFLMAQQGGSPEIYELLLDENYKLKMEVSVKNEESKLLFEENCALREENDQLKEQLSYLRNYMTENEIAIRSQLLNKHEHFMERQRVMQEKIHQNELEGLRRQHAREIKKLQDQIDMLTIEEVDSSSEDERR